MVEKIRISLWDIFSFFFTGMLASAITIALSIRYGELTFSQFFQILLSIKATILLLIVPFAFTLIGIVVEPFANYFDRRILKFLLGWASKSTQQIINERKLLCEEIRSKYMGSLNGKIEDPYYICKEYVETKQLSTTFMVYLSRYGFYRNCAFISSISGFVALCLELSLCTGLLSFFIGLVATTVFKCRAENFYSYMGSAIYSAFLIDKIWDAQKGS